MKKFNINILGLKSTIVYCSDSGEAYQIALEACISNNIDPKFIQIEG